ncbi:hypothetical protein RsS62_55580 [Rhizobium dioscoreae]|nr:hypothetical protein RsS62_55580 [Rhizobium dioscoreae]
MVGIEVDRGNEVEVLSATEVEIHVAKLRMNNDPEILGQFLLIFSNILSERPYVDRVYMEARAEKLQGIRETECLAIRY